MKKMVETAAQRFVFILGMHRSGTSCLAGCLRDCGLNLGDVVESTSFNPKGTLENIEVAELNEGILKRSGGTWCSPPHKIEISKGDVIRRDRILAQFSGSRINGLKDPRLLLIKNFWDENIQNAAYVGIFRHPEQVAHSLKRRNGIEIKKALQLWNLYNERLLSFRKRQVFPILSFDEVEHRFLEKVGKVAYSCGLSRGTMEFYDSALIREERRGLVLDSATEDCHQRLIKLAL